MQFDFGFGYIPMEYQNHWNTFYEFHFFTKGSGYFKYSGKRIEIVPHLLIVSPPREEHSLIAQDPLIFHLLKISEADEFTSLLDQYVELSRREGGILLNEGHGFIFENIRMLSHLQSENAGKASWFRLISLLYEILIPHENSSFRMPDNVVMRAVHFLRERIQERVSLDSLADTVKLNKSYFSRLFKAQTGYAPMDYFLQMKIDAAGSLLRETDYTNKQIADYFSFTDEYYFSKLFKKKTGSSPSEFRKQIRVKTLTE